MTHEILWFDNLVLLGFDTPRQESLNGVKFSPDMFSKVNIKGMQIVVHFFLQKIFGEEAIKESFKFCWPILDATQGKDFQKTAGSVLESLESQSMTLFAPITYLSEFLPQGSFVETDKTQLENDWRLQVQKYRSTYLRGYDARTVGSYAIRLLDDQLFLDSQQINEWLRALVISPTENKQSETSDFQNSLSISPRRTDPLLSVIGESHESLWTTKTVVGFDQAKQPPNFHSSQTNLVLDAELLRLNESLTFLLCEINGVAGGLRDGVPLSSLKSLVILWKEAERNAGEQLQGRDAQIVSVVSNLLRWHRNGVQTGNQINTDLHHAKQQLTRMIADLNRFELNSFYAVLEQAAQNNFRKARHTHTIIPATPLRQIVSLGTPQIQNRHYPR
ncbi:hypothetical protein BLNAU_13359 [Blattamonas nauphoetae]|uniref:HAUS augmin-like complex subunit 6 N-terminal domain-containing protein n=1 Tax=Blattamonas nauphoetae TaxID=2049346 RepID=A0ABQ9XM99_9EUKA|nr:hypothetical protein BLNAU_13359 [Blattamonas nauphoetae]